MKEEKGSNVVKEILYKISFQKVEDVLNYNFYSILVNESTAIDDDKLLCLSFIVFNTLSQKN